MSRMSEYLGYEGIHYAADVQRLISEIPELMIFAPKLVEQMYSDYSDTRCASWLVLDDETLEDFRDWVRS
jgi:hypothetical protein